MALTDSQIASYHLDEASGNAIDAHSTNTLTDTNTVTAITGKIGGARVFAKGNSEYFTIADNAAFSPTPGVGFTITGWFNLTALSGGLVELAAVCKGDFSAATEYVLYLNVSNHWVFFCGNGSAGANADAGVVATAGVWTFIAAWYDPAAGGTNNIQLDNGTPVSSANVAGVYDGAFAFRIGATSTPGRYYDGLADEVNIWKRVLTSGERTQVFGSAYPFLPIGRNVINSQAVKAASIY